MSFLEQSSKKMDVFPSIETLEQADKSTNNVLVRLVAAFKKVEDNINNDGLSDVANQISRLKVSQSWVDRDADKMLPPDDLWVILTVLTTALVTACLLVSYWLLWSCVTKR